VVLSEWRCRKCKRVLMEHAVERGIVIKKCDKCGAVNRLEDGTPRA
jgi:phage FluMu protein Com